MTRATCVAALRDEAETWIHVPTIRQALRGLADVVDTLGPEAAEDDASAELGAAPTPAWVEAYQTALEMLSECEDNE